MTSFVYPLGSIVVLDPTHRNQVPLGRVIGYTRYENGSIDYVVSTQGVCGGLTTHYVTETEIHWPEDKTP